jgi:hypothetical protein
MVLSVQRTPSVTKMTNIVLECSLLSTLPEFPALDVGYNAAFSKGLLERVANAPLGT